MPLAGPPGGADRNVRRSPRPPACSAGIPAGIRPPVAPASLPAFAAGEPPPTGDADIPARPGLLRPRQHAASTAIRLAPAVHHTPPGARVVEDRPLIAHGPHVARRGARPARRCASPGTRGLSAPSRAPRRHLECRERPCAHHRLPSRHPVGAHAHAPSCVRSPNHARVCSGRTRVEQDDEDPPCSRVAAGLRAASRPRFRKTTVPAVSRPVRSASLRGATLIPGRRGGLRPPESSL